MEPVIFFHPYIYRQVLSNPIIGTSEVKKFYKGYCVIAVILSIRHYNGKYESVWARMGFYESKIHQVDSAWRRC